MNKLYLSIIVLVSFAQCSTKKDNTEPSESIEKEEAIPPTVIAFGSCANTEKVAFNWQSIIDQNPDAWVWLGDIIYADTEDMSVMKAKYDQQKALAGYRSLIQATEIYGTWDDHDYGQNDAGKEYPMKKESRDLLLDFLGVPENAEVRNHEGMYHSKVIEKDGRSVKLILLDTRYFRDMPNKTDSGYAPNYEGTILGEAQWNWFKEELSKNEADIHIIGSSIQLISSEHKFEKWRNFPNEEKKFYDLLAETNPNIPIVISGDRHIAEISKIDVKGLDQPLYDFTSSGMTSTWGEETFEINSNRVGEMIYQKNFGVIEIDWSKKRPKVTFKVIDADGMPLSSLSI